MIIFNTSACVHIKPQIFFRVAILFWMLTCPWLVFSNEEPSANLAAKDGAKESAGEFVQKRWLSISEQPLVSHGAFKMDSSGGVYWSIHEPFDITYVFVGGELSVNEFGETRMLAKKDEPLLYGFFGFFSRLLDLSLEELEEWFTISLQTVEPVSETNEERIITIVPHKQFMQKAFLRAEVHELNSVVQGIVIHEAEGDRLELEFSYSKK